MGRVMREASDTLPDGTRVGYGEAICSRPDLARPKGLAWLAKYCHAHGLRKVQDPHAAPREAGRAFHLELIGS